MSVREEMSGRGVDRRSSTFPFTAIVGQEALRRALLILAVNPRIGGLLVRGEKGTAKSTAVRSLAALLPRIRGVADCPYHCDPTAHVHACAQCRARAARSERLPLRESPVPVVDLPVGASVDRVVGAIDFEHALRYGRPVVEPGLLAAANRGLIYVDEINLLEDYLADVLLDVLATGVNIIEREGLSCSHPARFALIGTMNPEEGELRPQLLDRFGICVQVEQLDTPASRIAVLQQREEYDADPEAFRARYARRETDLRARLAEARRALPGVWMPAPLHRAISKICLMNGVAGHRADLTIHATARAIAALEGAREVSFAHLREASHLALPHRARDAQPDASAFAALEQLVDMRGPLEISAGLPGEAAPTEDAAHGGDRGEASPDEAHARRNGDRMPAPAGDVPSTQPQAQHTADASVGAGGLDFIRNGGQGVGPNRDGIRIGAASLFRVPALPVYRTRVPRPRAGKRARARTQQRRGRYVRSRASADGADLALDATLRAAAPHQAQRRSPLAVAIEPQDLRQKVREQRTGYLLIFIVDASGSMGTALMRETKAAMISLLLDAYQRRDRVALVTFAGDRAEVLLPPTNSVDVAQRLLADLPAGGKTPLAHGLLRGYDLAEACLRRLPDMEPWLILVSDGEANVGLHGDTRYDGAGYRVLVEEVLRAADAIRRNGRVRSLVLDTESQRFAMFRDSRSRESMARRVAHALGASYARLEHLRRGGILDAVRLHVR